MRFGVKATQKCLHLLSGSSAHCCKLLPKCFVQESGFGQVLLSHVACRCLSWELNATSVVKSVPLCFPFGFFGSWFLSLYLLSLSLSLSLHLSPSLSFMLPCLHPLTHGCDLFAMRGDLCFKAHVETWHEGGVTWVLVLSCCTVEVLQAQKQLQASCTCTLCVVWHKMTAQKNFSEISEERIGKNSEKRLLVNPYGPEIRTELFADSPGENDLNSEQERFANPLLTAMFLTLLPLMKCLCLRRMRI